MVGPVPPVTVRLTGMVTVGLWALGAVMVIVAEALPADWKFDILTLTVRLALFVPEGGVTEIQPALSLAVQDILPPPVFEIEIVWLLGFTPSMVLKLRLVGLTVKIGPVTTGCQVKVTLWRLLEVVVKSALYLSVVPPKQEELVRVWPLPIGHHV